MPRRISQQPNQGLKLLSALCLQWLEQRSQALWSHALTHAHGRESLVLQRICEGLLPALYQQLLQRVWRVQIESIAPLLYPAVAILSRPRFDLSKPGPGSNTDPLSAQLQNALRDTQSSDSSPLFNEIATIVASNPQVDLCTRLYEHFLSHCLSINGDQVTLIPSSTRRKRSGSFYTPGALAEPLIARTLLPLLEDGPQAHTSGRMLRIVDLSMGGGSLLLTAFDFLINGALHPEPSATVSPTESSAQARAIRRLSPFQALQSLYGIDLDPVAVQCARYALLLRYIQSSEQALTNASVTDVCHCLQTHFIHGDALTGVVPTVDLNPPLAGAVPPTDVDSSSAKQTRMAAHTLRKEADSHDGPALDWVHAFPSVFVSESPRQFSTVGSTSGADTSSPDDARSGPLFCGFDAVIGNPPWEIHKPDIRAFLERWDIKAAGNSTDQRRQQLAHLLTHNRVAGAEWNQLERQNTLPNTSYRFQGKGDLNAYKLFIERSWQVLRPGGRMGLIVPAGIYSDFGATPLRQLLLEHNRWELLASFENYAEFFPIDRRFKFCCLLVEKGHKTDQVKTSFMLRQADAWQDLNARYAVQTYAHIKRFSPRTLRFMEYSDDRTAEIVERLLMRSDSLNASGPDAWAFQYRRELDMTVDAECFVPRTSLSSHSIRQTLFGTWIQGDWQPVASEGVTCHLQQGHHISLDGREWISSGWQREYLPLVEGRFIGQFDAQEKGWYSGRARSARWELIPHVAASACPPFCRPMEPQFLVERTHLRDWAGDSRLKVGFMAITSASNTRSMISSLIMGLPCGNSVPVLSPTGSDAEADALLLTALLNSFWYDLVLRHQLGGQNLNRFLLEEIPLLQKSCISTQPLLSHAIQHMVLRLNATHPRYIQVWANFWERMKRANSRLTDALQGWQRQFALTWHERTRLRSMLDALLASLFGLTPDDLRWLFRDCLDDRMVPSGSPIGAPSSPSLSGNASLASAPVHPHTRAPARATGTMDRRTRGHAPMPSPTPSPAPSPGHDTRGFFRVDQTRPPLLRHTHLTIIALEALSTTGLDTFLLGENGAGWQLPHVIPAGWRFDDPSMPENPLSAAGARFFPWQESLSIAEDMDWADSFLTAWRLTSRRA